MASAMTDKEIEAARLAALRKWRKSTKKPKPSERHFKAGTYGCHEALHTASLLLDAVASQLMEHPSVIMDSDWFRHAFKAHDELFRLYQAIGARHLPALPNGETEPANRSRASK